MQRRGPALLEPALANRRCPVQIEKIEAPEMHDPAKRMSELGHLANQLREIVGAPYVHVVTTRPDRLAGLSIEHENARLAVLLEAGGQLLSHAGAVAEDQPRTRRACGARRLGAILQFPLDPMERVAERVLVDGSKATSGSRRRGVVPVALSLPGIR